MASQDYLGVEKTYYRPVPRGFEAELADARRTADVVLIDTPGADTPTTTGFDYVNADVLLNQLSNDGGDLVGVVDWEEACIGDPLADLAIARLDLLWAFGLEPMRAFTGRYAALSGLDLYDLPLWDLDAALRPVTPALRLPTR